VLPLADADRVPGTPEAWSKSTEEQAYVRRGAERELAPGRPTVLRHERGAAPDRTRR